MKRAFYLIIIILSISCKKSNTDKELRKEIDRIKNEELPNKNYSLTSFELDSLNGKKFFSEIRRNSNFGVKSINISTEYLKNDSLIGKIENGPFENTNLLSHKIIKYRNGNENLYYLLEDENGVFIYEIKYIDDSLKKSRIETNYLQWNELVSELQEVTE